MSTFKLRKTNIEKRKSRIRPKVLGTAERPRLSVFRSNKYIYAQLINDVTGTTIVDVSKEAKEMHKATKKTDASFEVGKLLAQKATEKKIKKATFDRSGYRYHGRVKMLADGAREGGLEI